MTYKAAQTAGNLNVVIVGRSDATSQVSSVTDSKGNVYQLAVGPTVQTGSNSALAIDLLRKEHLGCHSRLELGDGELHRGGKLSGHSDFRI